MKNLKNNEAAQSVSPQTPKAHKRAYNVAPERKISNAAMVHFHKMPQELQNTNTKKLCVKQAISTHPQWVSDEGHYWAWLQDQTKLLTRVWDFSETCKNFGLDETAVAQHLVLEGQQACNFVRMNGLQAYGEKIKLFHQALHTDPKLLNEAGGGINQREKGHE